MSAREYIFISYAPCAYQYNKKIRKEDMYSVAQYSHSKISKLLGLISPLKYMYSFSTGINPFNLTDLNYEYHATLTTTSMIVFILSHCHNPRLVQAGFLIS